MSPRRLRWAHPALLLAATLAIAWLWVPSALFLFLGTAVAAVWSAILVYRSIGSRALKAAWCVVLLLLALPGLMAMMYASGALANNRRLDRFAAQLYGHPVPAQSRIVNRGARVGVLTGNGNHCDFIAEIQLASPLPLDAVRTHYERLSLRPAIHGGTGGPPWIDVVPVHQGFTVVVTDAPYEGIPDPRCT